MEGSRSKPDRRVIGLSLRSRAHFLALRTISYSNIILIDCMMISIAASADMAPISSPK